MGVPSPIPSKLPLLGRRFDFVSGTIRALAVAEYVKLASHLAEREFDPTS